MPATPLEQIRIEVAAVNGGPLQRLPVPHDAAAPTAEVEDRRKALDVVAVLCEDLPERPRAEGTAVVERLNVEPSGDEKDHPRRGKRQSVGRRPAAEPGVTRAQRRAGEVLAVGVGR